MMIWHEFYRDQKIELIRFFHLLFSFFFSSFFVFFNCVHVSIDAQTGASRNMFTNNNDHVDNDRIMARLGRDSTPRGNDTNRELARIEAARRAMEKQSRRNNKRNGSGKRFAEVRFSIKRENRARDRFVATFLIRRRSVDNRFDDRIIDPRSNRNGCLPGISSSFSSSTSSFSLISIWDFLCRGWTIGFSSSLLASFFFCCSSSAAGPDYMIMHLPFSAQGLFFLSGACISGSFFSFSSTYSRILRKKKRVSRANNAEIAI